MTKAADFELWLEAEMGDPAEPANRPQQNFCNINVTLPDGRVYALNVWTFDFLPLARLPWPYDENADQQPADHVVGPDLFVTSLTRQNITNAIGQLIASEGMLDQWLIRPDHDE